MAYYSAPILHQRMRGYAVEVAPPVDQPIIGVTSPAQFITEGGTINMTITRTGIANTVVSYSVLFTSEAGDADFSTPPAITREMVAGQFFDTVNVTTVQRTGTQGSRICTCVITAVPTGLIDPLHPQASITILDFEQPPVGTGFGWWKQLNYRSGRPWAAGTCNWSAHLLDYEAIAYLDAFTGVNTGPEDVRLATWELLCGGPKGNPDSIDVDGQLNWNANTHFSNGFALHPVNRCWVAWTMMIVPNFLSTERNTAAHTEVWDIINSGTQDQYFRDMGGRIRRNCANRGLNMDWLILRCNHENEQSNKWRVFSDAKNQWKSAAARAFDLIREGADHNIRIFFSPGQNKEHPGGTGPMGTLESWCPSNVDGISMSFHANRRVLNKTIYLEEHINGSPVRYGLEADALELAVRKGWPLAFCEWGPRTYHPIADDTYRWFYDEFLNVYHEHVIFDTLFDSATLSPSTYDGIAEGKDNWDASIPLFKDKWRGKRPNDTGFNRPSWPDDAAPIPSFAFVRPPVILGPSRDAPPAGFIFAPAFTATAQNNGTSPEFTSRDYRGKTAIQHNVGQGPITSFNFTTTGGTSGAFFGGKVRTTNVAFSSLSWREVLAAEWGTAPGINWAAVSDDAFAEAWDIRDAVNAIAAVSTISLNHRLYNRAMYIYHARNACINNDAQRTMTFDNVYLNGYSCLTQITGSAQSGAITVFKNSIFHLDRLPYDTTDGTTAPAANSKRVGPYTGPGSLNEGIVSGTADGFAHGWFFRSSSTSGGLYKMRVDMSDCLMRIDTTPVTGANVSFFLPAGDGVGAGSTTGSRYQRVTVLWFGGGTWDAAGFGQTKAQLATLGVTVIEDEAIAWDLWTTTRNDFFAKNGYVTSTDTFSWNITAGASPPEDGPPVDGPEPDDPATTVPTSWPYSPNTFYNRLSWTGINRHYQSADQHCMSERADGALIDIGADDLGWSGGRGREEFGLVAITGNPPTAAGLSGTNLAVFPDGGGPPLLNTGKAKPQAIICLPSSNIAVFWTHQSSGDDGGGKVYVGLSTDNGATMDWNDDPGSHIFSDTTDGLVVLGALQTFAGYSSMPADRFLDGDYVHVFLNNRRQMETHVYNQTPGGSPIYMARCKFKNGAALTALKVRANWEMFAGLDGGGEPTWSTNKSNKQPIFADKNGIGLFFQVGWHTALDRFVACYVHSSPRNPINSLIPNQAIAVATNKYPWKESGWRMLAYGRLAPTENDETNFYMSCVAPNRWNDGTTMYLGLSTYVTIPSGGGSGDNLIITKATLTPT